MKKSGLKFAMTIVTNMTSAYILEPYMQCTAMEYSIFPTTKFITSSE